MAILPVLLHRNGPRRLSALLIVAAALLCLSPATRLPHRGTPRMIQLTPTPIAVLPPGTVIPDGPAEGWTHLIAKRSSRVHSGDVDHLDDNLKHLASFLSSALLLRVERPAASGEHRLGEIAFGISTRIGGKDTVISSETQAKLGAKLGFFERLGLSRAEARLPGLLVAARSDTMIVLDAPTQLLCDGRHRVVILRSCVLLDARTGNVETVTYVVELKDGGGYGGVMSDVAWLPPNHREEILLHVDSREFVLGLISEKALAMPHLTKGRMHLPMPEGLKPIAARKVLTAEEFEALERGLRRLLPTPKA
jgi:hypothetical protein